MVRKQKYDTFDGIDEDTRPSPKKDKRRTVLLLWMVSLVMAWTLAAIASLVMQRPHVFGLATFNDLTETHVMFDQTRQALEEQRLNNDSTALALSNRQQRLDQFETQIAINAQASLTADALVNAQQATQAALNYQATEAAVQREATQIELNYRSTQAALNQEATANALGFGTEAPVTPMVNMNARWQTSNLADWEFTADETWLATRNGAWLISNEMNLMNYTFDITLVPSNAGDYYVLLNAPNGLALNLTYGNGELQRVRLMQMTYEQLQNGLDTVNSVALFDVQTSLPTNNILTVHVDWQNKHLIATVNGASVIDIGVDIDLPAGGVGIQVPQGTTIQNSSFLPK